MRVGELDIRWRADRLRIELELACFPSLRFGQKQEALVGQGSLLVP